MELPCLQAAALGSAMLDSRMTRTASDAAKGGWSGTAAAPLPFTVPIFLASAVTGAAVPLLHAFLNALLPASGQTAGSPSPPASPTGPSVQRQNGAAAAVAEQQPGPIAAGG